MYTEIPGQNPIELKAYYSNFVDYYPTCEMQTKKWFVDNTKEDWIILDCGANIGYFTLLFARLAYRGKIFAFEPTNTFDMLKENIAYHETKNVTVIPKALGNKIGNRKDAIFRIWGQEPETKIYHFTTIDEFVREHNLIRVDCIKIEVDSFDFEVLQGAERTLFNYDPFVVVELNHALAKRQQSNMQALQWMCSKGYQRTLVLDQENFVFKRNLEMINPTHEHITIEFQPY